MRSSCVQAELQRQRPEFSVLNGPDSNRRWMEHEWQVGAPQGS